MLHVQANIRRKVQIDELKFKLTESNLEALRDLASRMLL